MIKLWKFLVATIVTSHWLACLYFLMTTLDESACAWDNKYFGGVACTPAPPVGNAAEYVASLYWAVMTVATVGYGDVPPASNAERAFAVAAMLIGAGLFFYVLGEVNSIVVALSARDNECEALMDTANAFIADADISEALAERVRAFLRARRSSGVGLESQRLLTTLSPALRDEVALTLNRTQLARVPFFGGIDTHALAAIALALTPAIFPQGEMLILPDTPPRRMFIIVRGLVIAAGRVRARETCVGQDMVFRSRAHGYSAATLTFVELLVLTKDDLLRVLARFPAAAALIRRKAVLMKVHQQVLQFARSARKAAALGKALAARAAAESRAPQSHSFGSVVASASVPRQLHALLRAVRALDGCAAFPVAFLLVVLAHPSYEATLARLATHIQRTWRARRARMAAAAAAAAAARADDAAATAELQRDRDAPPALGVVDGERVVVVYGAPPPAAELLRESLAALHNQIAELRGLLAPPAGKGAAAHATRCRHASHGGAPAGVASPARATPQRA